MTDRPTILIVDDERLNRLTLADLLQRDYRVLMAKNGGEALDLAQREADAIVLILLDVSMPGMTGYEVLSALRSDESTGEIATIFITGQNEEADEEMGLRLGAADYIHKPIRPALVGARVRNVVNLVQRKKELERLAHSDGLTGIANRRHFDRELDKVCRRAMRTGETVGIALIDIDHFKLFNDHYGHLAGDDALRQVARLLDQHARRPYDLAARLGGEEFVLLIPHGDGILERAERFRQGVLDLAIAHPPSPTADFLTVSCGVVLASNLTSADMPRELLRQADEMLYQAKVRGRNQVLTLAM